jgi:ATP-dependent Lhr-like helicase
MAAAPIANPEIDTALAWAHPVVQEWFVAKFGTATEPQQHGWPSILAGNPTLISAPTGSGKTLSAFLVCIDHLLRQAISGNLMPETQVVYISPLKALSNDVQKNLDGPLAEIQALANQRGYLCPEIRTGVRTGDTLTKERTRMLKHPPHILVTTPESLYILLTAGKSRENLRRVRTVIVDEIHAIADDKRGAHLALSLERLGALVRGENRLSPGAFLTGLAIPPQRIGLSATQNPIELVAAFLTGVEPEMICAPSFPASSERVGYRAEARPDRPPATIIQVGQRRALDLAIEIPSEELGSIATTSMWTEIYDKLAACTEQHRSTLVFVNTRRLVEKISFELAERLGIEHVAAHHGSLSRTLRLDAEQRLKNGEIKILIATASLELGIDIGDIDLVCQIASTRAVATAMQRVGRAGHWRGAIPKGRFFSTTRDDLMEQAALIRKMKAGELDLLEIPHEPTDVLMQQIVAMVGAEPWDEAALFEVVRRAYPYRTLTRDHFDRLIHLLTEGIESTRGKYGAYLLRDGVHGQLHPRRGSRSIAISNGGAIPDTNLFAVILQPEGVQIATLDEHFAVDSSPGDIVLLGNASWRIQKIESIGKVLVEDAHGAPPTIPFWEGEAPQRTGVLSDGVSDLRETISALTPNVSPTDLGIAANSWRREQDCAPSFPASSERVGSGVPPVPKAHPEIIACTQWLQENCCISPSAAFQLIAYIVSGRAVLGAVPTKTTLIAERFFDDGGGMQLILHAPFGGRINKAWGLALRKRFCRGFNFELQAAATDNGINIALAEQHSFPLSDVFQFLTEHTAQELLEQAAIVSPIFKNRWRWAAGRSLQLLRFSKGKRIAPQIQRTRSDDLLANVFPQAAACFETLEGDIQIPDHPLANEVMKDVLTEAMDIEGLKQILRDIASGAIRCLAVDTPVPSQFAHELLNAMPYAFLDDADANERRARATTLRKGLPASASDEAGRIDPAAIATVRREITPDLRDEHELHDLLQSLVILPVACVETGTTYAETTCAPSFASCAKGGVSSEARPPFAASRHWPLFYERLEAKGRAQTIDFNGIPCWTATERLPCLAALQNETTPVTKPEAIQKLLQGWLQIAGPTTANALAAQLALDPSDLHQAFLHMEMQGLTLRGVFEHPATEVDHDIEWCERRILQRIHRLTLAILRKQVEAVPPATYMRWLLGWQHLSPQTQLAGLEGVLEALSQLEGFEAPAVEWERTLLPARVAHYDPRWLDELCLSGAVGWGRISPHPAWSAGEGTAPRRVIPTNAAPIAFYLRETADWLPHALEAQCVDEANLDRALSPEALQIRTHLATRGATFTNDLQRITTLTKPQTQHALWELATAGLAAADGFDQLRAMMDPRRKSQTNDATKRPTRTSAGRWSLLNEFLCAPSFPASSERVGSSTELQAKAIAKAIAKARALDRAHESAARMLLARYGILFRDLLTRETNAPRWRDLLNILRRLEARGEVRGGRFVTGFNGEQFALPQAVESLRATRNESSEIEIAVAAADPINLAGIVVPGERIPAVPGKQVLYRNGVALQPESSQPVSTPRTRILSAFTPPPVPAPDHLTLF